MGTRIGTAGWSVPREGSGGDGSQLQRYAAAFDCVEINSSFYRPHRPQTYQRWCDSAPPGFRFAVKAPRAITHEARLVNAGAALAAFLDQIGALGAALGPVLIQLPPSLGFDEAKAGAFFAAFRDAFSGEAVCEPRHRSWFAPEAEALLDAHRVGRVAADPAPVPAAATPGGWPGLRYWRLHGSPRLYYSAYGDARLRAYAAQLQPGDWCIFDNTAEGAALRDARRLQALMSGGLAMRPGSALK